MIKQSRLIPVFLIYLTLNAVFLPAESIFEQAEQLFMANTPEKAIPMLEAAVNENPGNAKTYLYLGMSYQQIGDYEKSISILRKGVDYGGDSSYLFYFNIGNNLLLQGKSSFAEEMFTQTIKLKGGYAKAYLNRANTRLKLGKNAEALSDYEIYLSLDALTPQRDAIEKIIALIRQAVVAEADAKAAADAKAREEAARQQAIMDQVLESLKNSTESAKNLSAESEDLISVETEDELE